MEKQNAIKWVDASKRSPRKGQHVLVLTKQTKKYNYQYNLCTYRNGQYWAEVHSKCYFNKNNELANKMDFSYVIEGVVAWTDSHAICKQAEDILKAVKWEE